MDRADFIISVYVMVCEHYQALFSEQALRHRGPVPAFSDEEVITLEICGAYFGYLQDEALYDYFADHWRHFFPALPSRTTFVRQAANLWQVKMLIHKRLTEVSGQSGDSVQVIDTVPLPVCTYTRARRDRCFAGLADYGYCDAKKLHYYGFKLGLRITRTGMIVGYALLPARPHDSQLLDDLVAAFEGIAVGDKGFIDSARQDELPQRRNLFLATPTRKNMKQQASPVVRTLCRRWRKRIETVASHLTERFRLTQVRAHDLWHYFHRLVRLVLAHTTCVFLNLLLGRPPLDLDDLVTSQ
jgi:hypothetical protein